MEKLKESKIKKLFNLITKISSFEYSDVDIILNMPFKNELNDLLVLVNLTENEKRAIDICIIKGATILEATDIISVSERQIANYLSSAKKKMHQVWSCNNQARAFLYLTKIHDIDSSIKSILNIK